MTHIYTATDKILSACEHFKLELRDFGGGVKFMPAPDPEGFGWLSQVICEVKKRDGSWAAFVFEPDDGDLRRMILHLRVLANSGEMRSLTNEEIDKLNA